MTERAVKFSGKLKGLCNRATYTLTVNENNNVDCGCSNVGSSLGTIVEEITTSKTGTTTIATDKMPFSLIRTDLNPVSLLGTSCVLSISPDEDECKCRNCPKIVCAPVKQLPACQINNL